MSTYFLVKRCDSAQDGGRGSNADGSGNGSAIAHGLSSGGLKRGAESSPTDTEKSLALAHGVNGSEHGDPREVLNETAASDGHNVNEWGLRP